MLLATICCRMSREQHSVTKVGRDTLLNAKAYCLKIILWLIGCIGPIIKASCNFIIMLTAVCLISYTRHTSRSLVECSRVNSCHGNHCMEERWLNCFDTGCIIQADYIQVCRRQKHNKAFTQVTHDPCHICAHLIVTGKVWYQARN